MTTFAYVTASGDDLIRVFEMDGAGRLTLRRDVPAASGPSALASSPDGNTLYCSLRSSRELASYRFESGGGLTPVSRRPLDADACYIAPDKTGRFLLSAYYAAGKAAVHRIEAGGSVGELVCTVPTAARAHCIESDASNRYVFVPHPLDANCIFQLLFSQETGRLTPNPATPRLEAAAGDGPRHFVISLDQRFLYTSNEDGSSVSAYHFYGPEPRQDGSEGPAGTLSSFQTLSTLPPGFRGSNTCAQIHLHPCGRWLYVSNRGHDSIAVFAVDTVSGRLQTVQWQETEAVPRVFQIDPAGGILLAAGQGSGTAASYAIDPGSGALSPLSTCRVGERPMWILFRQDGE